MPRCGRARPWSPAPPAWVSRPGPTRISALSWFGASAQDGSKPEGALVEKGLADPGRSRLLRTMSFVGHAPDGKRRRRENPGRFLPISRCDSVAISRFGSASGNLCRSSAVAKGVPHPRALASSDDETHVKIGDGSDTTSVNFCGGKPEAFRVSGSCLSLQVGHGCCPLRVQYQSIRARAFPKRRSAGRPEGALCASLRSSASQSGVVPRRAGPRRPDTKARVRVRATRFSTRSLWTSRSRFTDAVLRRADPFGNRASSCAPTSIRVFQHTTV